MRKKANTILIILAILVGVVVFSTTLVRAIWYAPNESEFSAPVPAVTVRATSTPSPHQWPVVLRIPSLGINAPVQSVGMSKKGNMAVPTNFTDVAWYKGRAAPGQVGSAVFNGHVDNGLGMDGVFKHLNEVQVGDIILVDSKDGKTYTYVVEQIKNYPYKSVPNEMIFNATDSARLTIITCEGAWVAGEKTYDHRLVVFATLSD